MTLDALIKKLTGLRGESQETGELEIVVMAPIADTECWLHSDHISIVVASEIDPTQYIRIVGGTGA